MSDGLGVRSRLQSFRYAARGIAFMVRTQHNAWIHLFVTTCVVGVAAWVGLDRLEWLWVIASVTAVWVAEGMNTALESLADAVSSQPDPRVGRAKDVAAGAVLIAAIGAAAIGLLVLGPRVLERL